MAAVEDDDWLLVRVGPHTVSLQNHETICRTGRAAGLSDAKILELCHLSDLERAHAKLASEARAEVSSLDSGDDTSALLKLQQALKNHIGVMEQIKGISR